MSVGKRSRLVIIFPANVCARHGPGRVIHRAARHPPYRRATAAWMDSRALRAGFSPALAPFGCWILVECGVGGKPPPTEASCRLGVGTLAHRICRPEFDILVLTE